MKTARFSKSIYFSLQLLFLVLLVSDSYPIIIQDRRLFHQPFLQSSDNYKHLLHLHNLYNIQYKDSFHLGIGYAQEALQLSKKLKNRHHEISAAIYIAGYYSAFGLLDKSLSYYYDAFYLNKFNKNPSFNAKILHGKGVVYYKKQEFDSSLAFLNKGLDLANVINDRNLLGSGYQCCGLVFIKKNEKYKALRYLYNAAEYYPGNSVKRASVFTELGIIYGDAGKIDLAAKYYLKALKIREEHKELNLAAYLYSNLAGIYATHLKFEKSIEYNLKALEVFKKINDKKGLGYVLNNIGQSYYTIKDYKKALRYFNSSLFYKNQINDKQAIAFSLTNIGEIYIHTNKNDSALYYLQKSLDISTGIKDELSTSVTFNAFGKYYLKQKKYTSAIDFFNKSIELTKKINYLQQLEDCYLQLSEVYKEINEPQSALSYLQLRNQVHDSIFSSNAQSYIANSQVQYEAEKLEKHESYSSQLKFDKLLIGFLIVLIIIIISGMYLYYKQRIHPQLKFFSYISPIHFKRLIEDRRKLKHFAVDQMQEDGENQKNIDADVMQNICDGIVKLLVDDKVFLDPRLNQKTMAEKLDTNTAYLSRIINEKYDTNFSSLINKYRIEEAKLLIKQNKHDILTFEGIAEQAGFNSKSAFNASFKKFTGITPSEYARRTGEHN